MSAPGAVASAQTSSGTSRREVQDVVAVVPVIGHRLATPDRGDRRAEIRDLAARVVEVVLARDLLAARLEHPAEQVADERAAGVADVERAGRVGRHEFDVDGAGARRRRGPTPPGRRGSRRSSPRGPRPEAAGSGTRAPRPRPRRPASPGRPRLRRSARPRAPRDRQRRHPVRPSEPHREVAGEVAVDRVGRALDLDPGRMRPPGPAARPSRPRAPRRARPRPGRRRGVWLDLPSG